MPRELLRQRARQLGPADIHDAGQRDAGDRDDQRRVFNRRRHMLQLRDDVLFGRLKIEWFQNSACAFADEPAVQHQAGEDRAGGQHQQRHQHDRGRFVHVLQRVVVGARLCRGRS